MNYRLCTTLLPHHIDQLVAMYQDEWWTKGRKRSDVEAMLQSSDFVFAYVDEDDNLIAFARVLTDRVYKAFLFDVIVKPQFRGTGIGARIVHDVTSHPVLSKVKHIELYCRPELQDFYTPFGFSSDTGGIVLMRRSAGG